MLLTIVCLIAVAAIYALDTASSERRLVGALAQYNPSGPDKPGQDSGGTVPGAASGAGSGAVADDPDQLATLLGGAAVVPGPGDPDGAARVTFSLGADSICSSIAYEGIGPPAAIRINRGLAGEKGPIELTVFPDSDKARADDGKGIEDDGELGDFGSESAPNPIEGCVAIADIADPDLIDQLRTSPESFYVEILNKEFPLGAVRGQVSQS